MDELLDRFRATYSFLPEEKMQVILGMGELVMLQEGDTFVRRGERVGKVAMVLQGMMRNYLIDANGEEVTVLLATEMQSIASYATIFLDLPATETSEAIEPTILFTGDFKAFKEKAEQDLDLMRFYNMVLEETLVNAIRRIEDFTQSSPEERYQRILREQPELIDRAPLKYLASYLGITPVSLSRIRKRISGK
ncbi:MAG: Crp/Fnr family transcriptional regulator [Bacteroidetes bacterium]|nr:Crp/Fnr family transcriptional regulator [Bacteroidota bacterium]